MCHDSHAAQIVFFYTVLYLYRFYSYSVLLRTMLLFVLTVSDTLHLIIPLLGLTCLVLSCLHLLLPLRYTTLHYTTLHYTTLHHITVCHLTMYRQVNCTMSTLERANTEPEALLSLPVDPVYSFLSFFLHLHLHLYLYIHPLNLSYLHPSLSLNMFICLSFDILIYYSVFLCLVLFHRIKTSVILFITYIHIPSNPFF